ncbi:MAG: type IV pilin [Candidatus Hadarchaeota archaeon]
MAFSECERGISEVVGEIILIAVIIAAMTMLAVLVLVQPTTPYRLAEIEVRLENAGPLPANNIKITLFHRGGDVLGIPTGSNSEFLVRGYDPNGAWENFVPWDSWVFSSPTGGFQAGENAVGSIRHSGARVNLGDKVRITITDIYSGGTLLYSRLSALENSVLYS